MDQRQLEAIMFTDLVGYSALAERNEPLALELLQKHWALLRPVFSRFDGHEIKTIGDAFLIEFPSALRAVEAGLAIQRALDEYNDSVDEDHKIQIRIGIHLGDVERHGDDVFGDGVNIASRIEPLAAPGGLCISESVYAAVRNKTDVPFYSMGEQKLKNISQPIVVYSNRPDQKATLIKTNFWQELRRRNVFKAGVTYAIVAWLLMQLTDIAAPAMQLPGWTISFITYLLIIGFPLILLFAWAFELTPEGFKPSHHVELDESITHITGRKFDFAIIGLLLITVIFLVLENYVWVEEASPPVVSTTTRTKTDVMVETPVVTEIKSIAVLPFVNMSADPEQEYFSDGISEEILNGLAHVKDLRVAARTSSFYYKGKDVQLTEIGETLKVNHVLEGSVRKAGDRLRITAQLIKVDDGFHLWSESYDRELTDIFAIQDEIAKAVVDALKIELGVDAEQLVTFGTTNREAYDWYLRGKDALVAGTAEGFQRGIDYFNYAIEIDPDYADAYAYLAYAYLLQHRHTSYKELAPAIKQAYSRALELVPSHSEALCVQGYDKIFSDWDWLGAGKVFRAATRDGKVNDVCLGTYVWWYSSSLGKYDEAIALLRGAERVDPLNLEIKFQFGVYLGLFNVDSEEAISPLRAVLDATPNHLFALVNLTHAYLHLGQLDKAESVLTRLESLNAPDAYPFSVDLRVELEVLRGDSGKAQSVYDLGQAVAKSGVNKSPNMWFSLAGAAAYLGYLDESIPLFNRAFEEGAAGIIYIRSWIKSWPSYTQGHGPALMARPDFQAFLKRMNLDDASMAELEAAEAAR